MATKPAGIPRESRERWARTYEETPYHELPWFSPRPHSWVVDAARSGTWIRGTRILDLGCGAGANALFLAARGFRVTGIDVAPGAIEAARARATRAGLKVDFRVGEVLELAFPDEHFGGAIDIGCFHTLPVRLRRLYSREGARVLHPRRVHALSWIAGESPNSPGPPHHPSLEEVTAALEEEFLFLRSEYRPSPSGGIYGGPPPYTVLCRGVARLLAHPLGNGLGGSPVKADSRARPTRDRARRGGSAVPAAGRTTPTSNDPGKSSPAVRDGRRGRGSGRPTLSVTTVRTAGELDAIRDLFSEYGSWLSSHREITAFPDSILRRGLRSLEDEIAMLPGAYGPPAGRLFLARVGGQVAGCGAVRPIGRGAAEVKRVFVRPQFRGLRLGRRITNAAVRAAGRIGYRRVVLDTLPKMSAAIGLYRSLGFVEIPAYRDHPVPGALFFAKRLKGRRGAGRSPPGVPGGAVPRGDRLAPENDVGARHRRSPKSTGGVPGRTRSPVERVRGTESNPSLS